MDIYLAFIRKEYLNAVICIHSAYPPSTFLRSASKCTTPRDLGQGGPALSRTLFNKYILGKARIRIPAKILLFADNVILYNHDPNLAITTTILYHSVSRFNPSINSLFLILAPQKCESIFFSPRPYNTIIARILFINGLFDGLDSYKYLGNILDARLLCKPHIRYLRDRSFATLII